MITATIKPLGDLALTVEFRDEISPGVNAEIRAFLAALDSAKLPAIVECVPAYRAVTVYYRPEIALYPEMARRLQAILNGASAEVAPPAEIVEIPVCYGGEFGPDLPFVAEHSGLSQSDVIRIHAAGSYLVYMLGFTPGFPYLGGMDARIAAPRLAQPRALIPAGSVGIAGEQTGVYPLASPGGWRIIGRTPLALYDPAAEQPILLRAGQSVRFVPIDEARFRELARP